MTTHTRTLKAAAFVPHKETGYLVCPHCNEKYADRGCSQIGPMAAANWEAMSTQVKWHCPSCKKRFALPPNPFNREATC